MAGWARSPELWSVTWLCTQTRGAAASRDPQAAEGPRTGPGAALPGSRRAEGAAMPSAPISTVREGIWAILHKAERRELQFPPSAIAPKLLLYHSAERQGQRAVTTS